MGIPHGDDAAGRAARCPDQNDTSLGQMANRDEPFLAVVLPVINAGGSSTGEDLAGISEIQPALRKSLGALGWVEADVHVFLYTHKLGMSIIGIQKMHAQRPLLGSRGILSSGVR
jgi:hypothetical protein